MKRMRRLVTAAVIVAAAHVPTTGAAASPVAVTAEAELLQAELDGNSEATNDGGSDDCDEVFTEAAVCELRSNGSDDGASGFFSGDGRASLAYHEDDSLSLLETSADLLARARGNPDEGHFGDASGDIDTFLSFEVVSPILLDVTGSLKASGVAGCAEVRLVGNAGTVFHVTAPNCDIPGSSEADTVDEQHDLDPGPYTLDIEALAEVRTEGGSTLRSRAGFDIDAAFIDCTITVEAPNRTTSGTPEDDVICGTPGRDTINGGLGGDDEIHGFGGNDVIAGGVGEDTLRGGTGRDEVRGEDDADTITGGRGSDGKGNTNEASPIGFLCGGGGPDTIEGDSGNDTLRGSECAGLTPGDDAIDSLSGGSGNDRVSDDFGAGENVLNGDADDDLIIGGDEADNIGGGTGNDEILAQQGDDVVVEGGDGDDLIEGGGGSDTLRGGRGSDKLRGQGERDTLLGGQRKDVLNGGPGAGDVMNACDGVRDDVIGGPGGGDRGRVDEGVDNVAASTEIVNNC